MTLYQRTAPNQHKSNSIRYVLVDNDFRTIEMDSIPKLLYPDVEWFEDSNYISRVKGLSRIATLTSYGDQLKASNPELFL